MSLKVINFTYPIIKELQPILLAIANKPKLLSFALLVHMRQHFFSTMVASISDKYGGCNFTRTVYAFIVQNLFPITSGYLGIFDT
jgi:hypothetical protein